MKDEGNLSWRFVDMDGEQSVGGTGGAVAEGKGEELFEVRRQCGNCGFVPVRNPVCGAVSRQDAQRVADQENRGSDGKWKYFLVGADGLPV